MLEFCKRHSQHGLEVADKPVDVPLSRDLVDDVLVVVVTEASTQLLVVHLRFVLSGAPPSGHLFGVDQLELPLAAGPSNAALAIAIRQKLEQKLPQLDGSRSCRERYIYKLSDL